MAEKKAISYTFAANKKIDVTIQFDISRLNRYRSNNKKHQYFGFMAEFGFYREKNEGRWLQHLAGWICDVLAVVTMAAFAVNMFGNVIGVQGRSMEPVLTGGDKVLVSELPASIFSIKRYDMVLFEGKDGKESIRRVIALPGETIQIKGQEIYVDDVLLENTYTQALSIAGAADKPVTLGEDEYFLLGDNGSNSEDSRFASVGNISQTKIRGKVWACIAPLEHMAWLG